MQNAVHNSKRTTCVCVQAASEAAALEVGGGGGEYARLLPEHFGHPVGLWGELQLLLLQLLLWCL